MEWYYVVGLVVLAVFAYKLIFSKPNKAVNLLGSKLNVQTQHIEEMISHMGAERGAEFTNALVSWPEQSIDDAVYTFYVYQILKNPHPKNVGWWRDKLVECGYDPTLDAANVEVAFMYLRDAGADITKGPQFIRDYQQTLDQLSS